MTDLLPVAEARRLIVEALEPVRAETVRLNQALGRVLRSDASARVSHPPVAGAARLAGGNTTRPSSAAATTSVALTVRERLLTSPQ